MRVKLKDAPFNFIHHSILKNYATLEGNVTTNVIRTVSISCAIIYIID